MAHFEKVSYEQYIRDSVSVTEPMQELIRKEYDDIKLPSRGTRYSAGYDLFAPYSFSIRAHEKRTVWTGIRVLLSSDQFFAVYPRSGLGCRFRVGLANSTGIIDADYSAALNEGHIGLCLVNDGDEQVDIQKGQAVVQGIIQRYDIVEDDTATKCRIGGFGSTDTRPQ